MTNKTKVRINWLNEWQVLEHEAWFEDMARQGWKLDHLGYWFARFIESDPEEISYRIEIAKKNDEIESDRIRLYEDAGWKYVTSKNHLYVFQEREAYKGKEVYTDPASQAETMGVLKKSIWRNGMIMLLATLIFGGLFWFDLQTMSSYQLLQDGLLNSFMYLIIYLPMSVHWIGGMIYISSLIRKRRRGESVAYHKTYKGKMTRNRLGSYFMAGVYIAFFSYFFFFQIGYSQAERFPGIPTEPLPVIQLTEVENVESDQVAYRSNGVVRERENHFYESESLLFPKQYNLRQKFIVPNEEDEARTYEPSIESNKYEARSVLLAEKLTDALLEETDWLNEKHPVKEAIDGFDEVWIFESEKYAKIIARQSIHVYDIYYQGDQSSTVFYEWLKELGVSHSST